MTADGKITTADLAARVAARETVRVLVTTDHTQAPATFPRDSSSLYPSRVRRGATVATVAKVDAVQLAGRRNGLRYNVVTDAGTVAECTGSRTFTLAPDDTAPARVRAMELVPHPPALIEALDATPAGRWLTVGTDGRTPGEILTAARDAADAATNRHDNGPAWYPVALAHVLAAAEAEAHQEAAERAEADRYAAEFARLQAGAVLIEKARKAITARRWTDRPGGAWHLEADSLGTPRYVGVHAKALMFTTDDGGKYDVRVYTLDGRTEIIGAAWLGLDAALKNGQRLTDEVTAERAALGRHRVQIAEPGGVYCAAPCSYHHMDAIHRVTADQAAEVPAPVRSEAATARAWEVHREVHAAPAPAQAEATPAAEAPAPPMRCPFSGAAGAPTPKTDPEGSWAVYARTYTPGRDVLAPSVYGVGDYGPEISRHGSRGWAFYAAVMASMSPDVHAVAVADLDDAGRVGRHVGEWDRSPGYWHTWGTAEEVAGHDEAIERARRMLAGEPAAQAAEAPAQAPPVAHRATMSEARRHFEAGGAVLVHERGDEPTVTVYRDTTTHDQTRTTWDELAAMVTMWRNRYPRQRFYIVPAEGPAPAATAEDDTHAAEEAAPAGRTGWAWGAVDTGRDGREWLTLTGNLHRPARLHDTPEAAAEARPDWRRADVLALVEEVGAAYRVVRRDDAPVMTLPLKRHAFTQGKGAPDFCIKPCSHHRTDPIHGELLPPQAPEALTAATAAERAANTTGGMCDCGTHAPVNATGDAVLFHDRPNAPGCGVRGGAVSLPWDGHREPAYLLGEGLGSWDETRQARIVGALAAEGDRWVIRDTSGRVLFDGQDYAAAEVAVCDLNMHRISSAWFGIQTVAPRCSCKTPMVPQAPGSASYVCPYAQPEHHICDRVRTLTPEELAMVQAAAAELAGFRAGRPTRTEAWAELAGEPVPAADLTIGAYARVVGRNQYGSDTSGTGYVAGVSTVKARHTRKGTETRKLVAVYLTETPSGANGWRMSVYAMPGATAQPMTPTAEVAAPAAPTCTGCGAVMVAQAPGTPEQAYVGTAYACPNATYAGHACTGTALTPSPALVADLAAQAAAWVDPVAEVAEARGVAALDVQRLRIAAEQTAATYYGPRGALTFGRGDAVRYVSEAWLSHRPVGAAPYTLTQVAAVVAEIVDARPEVLTLDQARRDSLGYSRDEAARAFAAKAASACKAGDYGLARDTISAGGSDHPDYLANFRTWDDMRALVDAAEAKATAERAEQAAAEAPTFTTWGDARAAFTTWGAAVAALTSAP